MVMTRTANTPITFGADGIVRYGENVGNTSQERIIVDVADTPITFTNSQGTKQYTQSGTGSAGQQAFTTN